MQVLKLRGRRPVNPLRDFQPKRAFIIDCASCIIKYHNNSQIFGVERATMLSLFIRSKRAAALAVVIPFLSTMSANAQNLHQSYGSWWDCSYISGDQPYVSKCFECERNGMEFFKHEDDTGECVPATGSDDLLDEILEEVDREYEQYQASIRWGAIATALWNDYEGVAHVAVGSSVNATSEHEAQQNALSQCVSAGGQGCQVVDSWNAGCGYIAIGKTSTGVFHVGGTTSTEALNRCWAAGYDCEGPIGGCVE